MGCKITLHVQHLPLPREGVHAEDRWIKSRSIPDGEVDGGVYWCSPYGYNRQLVYYTSAGQELTRGRHILSRDHEDKTVGFYRGYNTQEIGSSLFLHDNDVTLLSYMAKKEKNVLLQSSRHHTQAIGEKNKPEIPHYYNTHKGGVDIFDQLCAKYSCSRKTRRWSVCFFIGMVSMTVVNAYVIHKEQRKQASLKPKETRLFLREMAKGLVKPWAFFRLYLNGHHASVCAVIREVY